MATRSNDATAGDPALAHYRPILDVLPAAGALCDAQGRLVHYSPRAARLWGRAPRLEPEPPRYCGAYRLRSLAGTPLPPADSPMARALRERRACHGMELRIERPDGSERVAVVYASPLLDATGSLQGGLNLLVDVTARHRATHERAERLREREELRVALACDIRAGLDPLRRTTRELAAPGRDPAPVTATAIDLQLRHVTQLVDRLLNLEVDRDDAPA